MLEQASQSQVLYEVLNDYRLEFESKLTGSKGKVSVTYLEQLHTVFPTVERKKNHSATIYNNLNEQDLEIWKDLFDLNMQRNQSLKK